MEKYYSHVKEEIDRLREKGKKICVAPLGLLGMSALPRLKKIGVQIDYYYDNDPDIQGTVYCGIRCLTRSELEAMRAGLVVIICSLYYDEIKKQMTEMGMECFERLYYLKAEREAYIDAHRETFKKEVADVLSVCEDDRSRKIFSYLTEAWDMDNIPDDYFVKIWEREQYFDKDIIKLAENETFVDVGAYIGDTTEAFLKACGGAFEKLHLFELDPEIYKRMLRTVAGLDYDKGVIQCYPYGLSDANGTISFVSGDSNSTIVAEASDSENLTCGRVVRLDDILPPDEKITFIKMDIEGAEQAALRGAENIIRTQKPKLAICIYHTPEDMLKIPVYLKKLVPEYKIYIRHYTNLLFETVCYAVP